MRKAISAGLAALLLLAWSPLAALAALPELPPPEGEEPSAATSSTPFAAQPEESVPEEALPAADNIIWETAVPLSANTPHTASQGGSADAGWYVFRLPSAGQWQFSFSSPASAPNSGWYIELYGEAEGGGPGTGLASVYFRPAAQPTYTTPSAQGSGGAIYLSLLGNDPADFTLLFTFTPDAAEPPDPPDSPAPPDPTSPTPPNDSPAAALALAPNAALQAVLPTGLPLQYYTFQLPVAGLVTFVLESTPASPGLPWAANLYAAAGQEHAQTPVYTLEMNSAQAGGQGRVGLPAGRYYLCVSAPYLHQALPYSLALNIQEAENWEQEPNDAPRQANPVALGGWAQGAAGSATDLDWYTFTVSELGALTLGFSSDAAPEGEWEAELFPGDGQASPKALAAWRFSAGAPAMAQPLSLTPGVYQLRLRPLAQALLGCAYQFQLGFRAFALVTAVDVAQSQITLVKGSSATVAVLPRTQDGSDEAPLLWSSSRPDIISVDKNGRLTALASSGSATVTVSAENGVKNTFKAHAAARAKAVTQLAIRYAPSTIAKGNTRQLSPVITPSGATGAVVKWQSSKPSVLRVDATGLLTALKVGTAAVVLSAGGVKVRCTVQVVAPVRSVGLPQKALFLVVGSSVKVPAVALTTDGSKAALSWASSALGIVAADEKGRLTALACGQATVTVRAENGKKASLAVTVVAEATPVKKLKIIGAPAQMAPGGSGRLSARISPSGATGALVSWRSSHPAVLHIDKAGRLTALAPGSATLTATAGNKKAKVTVTVAAAP